MENAAKALLMAGAVLVALMGVCTIIYVFNQVGFFNDSQNVEREARSLKAFNEEYEAFNRKDLYGSDIISVINLIESNNNDRANKDNIYIDFKLKLPTNIANDSGGLTTSNDQATFLTWLRYREGLKEIVEPDKQTYKEYQKATTDPMKTNFLQYKQLKDFKVYKFKCDKLDYDNSNTGRVNIMEFTYIPPTI